MRLRRYEQDSRSIPVSGDSTGLADISPSSVFSILDHKVCLTDPENGLENLDIGTHMQYAVDTI